LENLVYLALKKEYEVYYHQEKKECDFIIRKNAQIVGAIQVCQQLNNADTRESEFSGLLEALARYSLAEGLILTEYEEATETVIYQEKTYKITILPIWKFLLQ
jgi:predicted AAA+ superfamily ATPase